MTSHSSLRIGCQDCLATQRGSWKSPRTWDVRFCWQRWNHERRSWQEGWQLLCGLWWAARLSVACDTTQRNKMNSRSGDSCTRGTDLTQTATRVVVLLVRVMEDHPPQAGDFRDWFMRWLDECEHARGRLIDDDIKVTVFQRVPKKLRGHLLLESPQLAHVESKFPVMRELVQHWCHSRETFARLTSSVEKLPRRAPLRVSQRRLCAHLAGMNRGLNRVTARERAERKAKEKEKARARKARRKGHRRKRNGGWIEPFRGFWKWGHKKAQCPPMAGETTDGTW